MTSFPRSTLARNVKHTSLSEIQAAQEIPIAECEREKVVQQFKENGLQDVIISLSVGSDGSMEKDAGLSEVCEGANSATAGWSGRDGEGNKIAVWKPHVKKTQKE